MGEEKENRKESGICFDNISLGELRKLMDKGIGSLCREMMDCMLKDERGKSACLQFMQKMSGQGVPEGEQTKEKEGPPNPDETNRRGS